LLENHFGSRCNLEIIATSGRKSCAGCFNSFAYYTVLDVFLISNAEGSLKSIGPGNYS
jgi:hypothetical protein